MLGRSINPSHESACNHFPCLTLHTSTQTWSVRSKQYLVSYPTLRQNVPNKLANSPQRPRRDLKRARGELKRGKVVDVLHSWHVYTFKNGGHDVNMRKFNHQFINILYPKDIHGNHLLSTLVACPFFSSSV